MIRTILFLVLLHSCTLCWLRSRRPVYRFRLRLGQLGSRTTPIPLLLRAGTSPCPYLWLSGIHGAIGVGGRDASVHAGFGDIISNLKSRTDGSNRASAQKTLAPDRPDVDQAFEDKGPPENQPGEITAKSRVRNFM